MKRKELWVLGLLGMFAPYCAQAWEAKVTNVLQHGNQVAIYLAPDPGALSCAVGQPYLLDVDDTPAAKQRFALIMLALSTGQLLTGWDDGCSTGIWAQSRPLMLRLRLAAP